MDDFDNILCFNADHCFQKGKNIKVFTMSSPQNTGEELHSHQYMQIWFVTKGVCTHWVGGKSHKLVRGEAFILPPFMVHSTCLDKESSIICCEFSLDNFLMIKDGSNFNILQETLLDLSFMTYFITDEKNICPKFSLLNENQDKVEQLLHAMLKEYHEDCMYSDQFIKVYTLELLLIFAREYTSLSNQEDTSQIFSKYKAEVKMSIEYICEHYRDPLSLEIICKYCAVSKTYFCYIFKLITNQTFVEYLLHYRIKKAIEALEDTDLPITKICFSVGFNDLSHFSRSFKKITGMSARAYRDTKANGIADADTPTRRLLKE